MQGKLFIQKKGLIMGPFGIAEVTAMLESGKLQPEIMASTNKIFWQPLSQILGLPVPSDADFSRKITASDSVAFIPPVGSLPEPPPAESSEESDDTDTYEDNEETADTFQKISSTRLVALSAASFFNSAAVLKEVSQQPASRITVSGFMMMVLALFLSFVCGKIFSRYYDVTPLIFILRFILFTLSAGTVLYLFTSIIGRICNTFYASQQHAIDFLSAMIALCNGTAVASLLNSVIFLFNRNLFNPTHLQMQIVLTAVLLPMGFFAVNGVMALRLNFIASDNMRSGTATVFAVAGLYITALVLAVLFFPIYPTLK